MIWCDERMSKSSPREKNSIRNSFFVPMLKRVDANQFQYKIGVFEKVVFHPKGSAFTNDEVSTSYAIANLLD